MPKRPDLVSDPEDPDYFSLTERFSVSTSKALSKYGNNLYTSTCAQKKLIHAPLHLHYVSTYTTELRKKEPDPAPDLYVKPLLRSQDPDQKCLFLF
jgi:hypothetical protein